eukprot:gene28813-34781_t
MNKSLALSSSLGSLSGHMRAEAKREFDHKKHQGRAAATQHAALQQSSLTSTLQTPMTLPHLSPSTKKKPTIFADTLATYQKDNLYSRLSGVVENENSSGLFSYVIKPQKPLSLCVRCSNHASLCMPCAEDDCEKTVTFYRKTRAAGAATLFNKAFVEAGNTKVIKFIVFRLLKNSFQNRQREQLKKKTVVEKLFGTNLVHIPFQAWRRYTKENIVSRKDKTIAKLSERVKSMDVIINDLNMNLRARDAEISKLKEDNDQLKAMVEARDGTIVTLEQQVKKEQGRVVALSALSVPIIAYNEAFNNILHQKMSETNQYLHVASTTSIGYDHTNVFADRVLLELGQLAHDKSTADPVAAAKAGNKVSKPVAATHRMLLDWASHVSQAAGDHMEQESGKLLSTFLPAHMPVETLSELRNAKLLVRVVIGIIYDRIELRAALATKKSEEAESCLTSSWVSPAIPLSELQELQKVEAKTMDLVTYTLQIATKYLDVPNFKAMDVFSGKQQVIFSFLVALLNAAVPTVDRKTRDSVEKSISSYYFLAEEVKALQQQQKSAVFVLELAKLVGLEREEKKEEAVEKANKKTDAGKSRVQSQGHVDIMHIEHMVDLVEEAMHREYNMEHLVEPPLPTAEGENLQAISADQEQSSQSPVLLRSASPSRPPTSHSNPPSSPPLQSVSASADPRLSPSSEQRLSQPAIDLPAQPSTPLLPQTADRYSALCNVIDQFIATKEREKAKDIGKRVLDVSTKFLGLQTWVFSQRQHTERALQVSSELRQFMWSSYLSSIST